MIKRSLFALLFLLGFSTGIYAEPTLRLVENGESRFVIVIDDNASDIIRLSAEQLNCWVYKITGVRLSIVTVSKWDGGNNYIAVGKSILTKENGWERIPFEQEEARVFIEKDRIGLLGNDTAPYSDVEWKGTYYAVNEFVRNALGVRWIWPGELGEVFERRSNLTVKMNEWNWTPKIKLVRQIVHKGMLSNTGLIDYYQTQFKIDLSQNKEWLLKREKIKTGYEDWANNVRLGLPSDVQFGHSFGNWWERFGQHHPDWFATPPTGLTQHGGKGVKLNISNSEVHDQIIEDWQKLWEVNPHSNRYLRAIPNDSRGFDTRPETRAWDALEMKRYSDKDIFNGSEPVLSDRYVKLWNILARRLKAISPDARLSTYAYRNYRKPPLGNEQIEGNIVISYVGGEGYYPDELFIRDEWERWADKGAKLVWRPNLLHAGHGTPYLYSRRLHSDMQFFMENGMQGFNFDSMVGNWAGQGLNYYMISELPIRPNISYEELVDEYFAAFGPARNIIRRYHEYFEELTNKTPQLLRNHKLVSHETWGGWWKAHIRVIPLVYTPEVISKGEALLEEARITVRHDEDVYLERIEFIAEGLAHAKIMSEVFGELQLHDPKVQVDFVQSKKILQPLWDFRVKRFGNFYFAAEASISREHQQFRMWEAFALNESTIGYKEWVQPIEIGWKFYADSANIGNRQKWQVNKSFSSWNDIQIEMPWRQSLPNVPETRVGWYAVDFEVPELEDTGQKVFLRFGSIDAEAKVWVNGHLVNERGYPHNGNYDSWSEEFQIDVTENVKTASFNSLVIRVESERFDAGITGKVLLVIQ